MRLVTGVRSPLHIRGVAVQLSGETDDERDDAHDRADAIQHAGLCERVWLWNTREL